jgi:DNA replication ATP-dependent helicase Dna2
MTINVTAHRGESGILLVDNDHGFLVVEPDVLISCTSVATSFACLRKSILVDRLKGPGDINIHMLHGSILHELFQQGMLKDDFSSSFMDDEIRNIIKENLQELYFVGENEEVTFEHLKKFVEYFGEFQQLYMTDRPQARTYVYFIVIIFT